MSTFFRRGILLPWLLAAVVMFGLSYAWHGLVLSDLLELPIPVELYLALSGLVYLIIAGLLTLAVDQALKHDWIRLKKGFPFMGMLVGAAGGFVVYLIVYIMGMSFAAHNLMHVVVDILWQMFEQSIGGLMVTLGIIYDVRRHQLEFEGAG